MGNEQIILQLHYYFKDKESHSMNAEIHNECEKQFLLAILHLNKYLDDPIIVDVIPSEEGGFKDNFKLLIKHPATIALIASFGSAFFLSQFPRKHNTIEETSIKIDNISKINEMIQNSTLSAEEFEYITSNDKHLKKLKNKYFKTAKEDKTIEKIQFTGRTLRNDIIIPSITVKYDDFDNLLEAVENDVERKETEERIYIVSPVLTRGRKLNWRGLWNGKPISFRMENSDYLEKVYNHKIKFTSGSFIDCKLIVEKTINYNKDTIEYRYFVETIIENGIDDNSMIKLNPKVKNKVKSDSNSIQTTFFNKFENITEGDK